VLKSVDVKQTSAPAKAKAKASKSQVAAARRKSRARLFRVENTFRTLGL
jgi:hypothetical protein